MCCYILVQNIVGFLILNIENRIIELSITDIYMNGYELLENESMANHCTFKAGGIASRVYKVFSIEGLENVLNICLEEGVKPLIFGNGSNILVSDKGISTPVIIIDKGFDNIKVEGNIIKAEAGAMLSAISHKALENGLTGVEFASGIPGTVGGAVVMNAGAYGGEMVDVVKEVDVIVLDNTKSLNTNSLIRKTLTNKDMDFSYRHSRAMDEEMIIVGVTLELTPGEKEEISFKMNDFNSRRRDKQPLEFPSAGSTFKRPEGYFAGKLIMDSGLAGTSVGGAMVSPKHCGFIVNKGNATATDIYELIKNVQSTVKERFDVVLEPEVKLIGEF